MPTTKAAPKRTRVLVVGSGPAGSACAWSLSRFADRYDVQVWEANAVPGGVSSSAKIKDGKITLNDQVQGGAPSYRNNLLLLDKFGFKPTPVMMRISFGTGKNQWTNHSPSQLTDRCKDDIARFGRLLKWIHRFEPIFIFTPIEKVLKLFRFSEEFRNQMVFPLVALFFGTGNQTPNVAAAVIARVFLDPDLRLFKYSPTRLLDSVPEMFAFPVLQDIFTTISDKSDFTLHCNRPVKRVVRQPNGCILAEDNKGVAEEFDEIVYACDAETVLKTLKEPSWLEKTLLSNVTYFDDYCLTHEDDNYMNKMYDIKHDQRDNYFVRQYPEDPRKIEMSFNLSTYQPHLKKAGLDIYQTYYLDKRDKDMWTDTLVDKSKILLSRYMRQFAHTWKHFAFFVPWGRFIQGTKHTHYAGAYTLFNTQEIAVMSGFACAERLGAPYPFPEDELATKQFDMYLSVAHGVKRKTAKSIRDDAVASKMNCMPEA